METVDNLKIPSSNEQKAETYAELEGFEQITLSTSYFDTQWKCKSFGRQKMTTLASVSGQLAADRDNRQRERNEDSEQLVLNENQLLILD